MDDLDLELLGQYAEAVGAPDPVRLLQARGLARDGALTVAGCLLFSREPQEILPEAYVRVLRYRGSERGAGASQQLIADVRCDGSIPRQLIDAREATLALHVRFARNPRIARVCADQHFGFGQELGEGIRRMFAEMRQARLMDPLYRQTSGSVVLTLLAEPADRALEARLPTEARVITSALREADRLSTGEIAELLGISRPAAIRRLRAIEAEGLVKWVGKSPKDPRAYWTLAY